MAGIEPIGRGHIVFCQHLGIVFLCLFIFSRQQGTPSQCTRGLFGIRIEVVGLKEVFESLVILLQVDVTLGLTQCQPRILGSKRGQFVAVSASA